MAELSILLTTAISLAFIHTIIGVDHYLPFIVLSRTNNWTVKKTMLIVFLCGLGHVASSALLGFAGAVLSIAVSRLTDIESIRGTVATYFLIAFGIIYTAYGISRAVKNKTHRHITPEGRVIKHAHAKKGEDHIHSPEDEKKSAQIFWGLFIIFALGPCEPLIPILMYPAATHNTFALISVTASFAVCTIAAMMLLTLLGLKGVRMLKADKLERYSHALAGSAILACGIIVLALPV